MIFASHSQSPGKCIYLSKTDVDRKCNQQWVCYNVESVEYVWCIYRVWMTCWCVWCPWDSVLKTDRKLYRTDTFLWREPWNGKNTLQFCQHSLNTNFYEFCCSVDWLNVMFIEDQNIFIHHKMLTFPSQWNWFLENPWISKLMHMNINITTAWIKHRKLRNSHIRKLCIMVKGSYDIICHFYLRYWNTSWSLEIHDMFQRFNDFSTWRQKCSLLDKFNFPVSFWTQTIKYMISQSRMWHFQKYIIYICLRYTCSCMKMTLVVDPFISIKMRYCQLMHLFIIIIPTLQEPTHKVLLILSVFFY